MRALGGGIAIQHRTAYQGEYFIQRYGEEAVKRTPPIRHINGQRNIVTIPNSVAARANIVNANEPMNTHGISVVLPVEPSIRPATGIGGARECRGEFRQRTERSRACGKHASSDERCDRHSTRSHTRTVRSCASSSGCRQDHFDVEDIWRDVARSGELAHLRYIVRAETGWRAQCSGNRLLKPSGLAFSAAASGFASRLT